MCITCKFGKNQVFVSFAAVGCCHSKESKRIFFYHLNNVNQSNVNQRNERRSKFKIKSTFINIYQKYVRLTKQTELITFIRVLMYVFHDTRTGSKCMPDNTIVTDSETHQCAPLAICVSAGTVLSCTLCVCVIGVCLLSVYLYFPSF